MKKNMVLYRLLAEKEARIKGGLYHYTQINMSYNSNRIEGSRLTHEQTRFIYETHTFLPDGDQPINTDDIIETINHFNAFDYILTVADKPLSENIIKQLHGLLKQSTTESQKDWFVVGDYKKLPNIIGDEQQTTKPEKVKAEMQNLLSTYHAVKNITVEDVIDFHQSFESIHPFQDGNGRVGRLIMFKECLKHNITPFIIDAEHKLFYYRGLKEYKKQKGYLIDTCLSAQDKYAAICQQLEINTEKQMAIKRENHLGIEEQKVDWEEPEI